MNDRFRNVPAKMITDDLALKTMLSRERDLPIGADETSAFKKKRIGDNVENVHARQRSLLADYFGDKTEEKNLERHEKEHQGQAAEMIDRKDVTDPAGHGQNENKRAEGNKKSQRPEIKGQPQHQRKKTHRIVDRPYPRRG